MQFNVGCANAPVVHGNNQLQLLHQNSINVLQGTDYLAENYQFKHMLCSLTEEFNNSLILRDSSVKRWDHWAL